MNLKEVNLHDTMDASIWAKEFMRLHKKFGWEVDHEMMRGWFANSIMCGHDHAYWKLKKEVTKATEPLVEALEDHQLHWDETFQMQRKDEKVIKALAAYKKAVGEI